MPDWSKNEKTLMIIGVLTIAVILIGFAFTLVVTPMIKQTTKDIERAVEKAKAEDDRKIMPPSGSDLDIVGKWGDAISIGWTGKNTLVYEFKADGTYTYTSSGTNIKGTWGRLKGYSNQLVTRRDSDTYSTGSPLRKDTSSGKIFCDGFALVRLD